MLKTKNQLIFLLVIISILLAGGTTYYLSKNTYKFTISNQKFAIAKDYSLIYYDFDKDGNSEKYYLHNYEKTATSAIQFTEHGQIKRQFNFVHPLELRTIVFDDFDGDSRDEMILFTKEGDSLYISIINLVSLEYILHEELIFKRTQVNKYEAWDYALRSAQFIKTKDNKRKLLFALNSGFSFFPRGIYLYDVEKKEITNRFENEAAKVNLSLIDFDNDGYKEVVVGGMAPGNGSPLSKYSDNFAWLFVLDSELNLFWEPKKMTRHPSSYYATPFKHDNKSYLLSICNGSTNKDDWIGIRILDKDGKIIHELKAAINELTIRIRKFNRANSVYFIVTTQSGEARVYDFNLKLLSKKKLSNSRLVILDIVDIEDDGDSEYLFLDGQSIIVTDNYFEIIAKYDYDLAVYYGYLSNYSYNISSNSTLEIGYRSDKFYNLLSFQTSSIYTMLPFLFPIFLAIIFALLYLLHRVGQQISRHYSIHNYFINKTDSALLLFSPEKKIKAFNNQFTAIFGSNKTVLKNERLENILKGNSELLQVIDNAINTNKISNQEFRTASDRIGVIVISPIKSFWGFVYAYLLEFNDITNPIILERQKLWSKTSQKIAHDIKTPLSTIQLNLATLSKRIDEENISQKEGFKDDISMIRSEVNRIRNLTKGFLKFTNLEKPNMQLTNIKDLLEKSLQQFNSYTENGVKIATSNIEDIALFIDPFQIEQLFHIIIENSIDAMNGKGIIEIKIELAQKMNSNNFLQIEFSDNGKGIHEEKIKEIFEPYYTSKKDGTGLGLAIAQKIVDDNNGEISIYSKLGLGTTITVLLPFSEM